jgi:calcium/calmodulin-dependent protein kinase kinase 2
VDFTTVRYKGNDDISYFPTGTPGFRGPEHQFAGSDGYSCKATDVWAVGIAMWTFFHEQLPFPGEDDLERDINSKNMELAFSSECPAVVVEAIKKMTRKDWKDRITIDQALSLL